jgi:hypothetical protein
MNTYAARRPSLVDPRTDDAVGLAQVKVQDEMPEEAAAIARTLAYLRRHIALPCIADCHVRACVDLEEVAKRTRADAYRRITSGVSDPTDCSFSATVAKRVKKQLAQLRRIAMVRKAPLSRFVAYG